MNTIYNSVLQFQQILILGNQRQCDCDLWLHQIHCDYWEKQLSPGRFPYLPHWQKKQTKVWWQEKQICTYKVWKLFFKKENISAFPPPCSINSSWQAETTLIAREMKENEQQAVVQNQWHSAKSFIKWIIASTWQSVKCLFSYGFSF